MDDVRERLIGRNGFDEEVFDDADEDALAEGGDTDYEALILDHLLADDADGFLSGLASAAGALGRLGSIGSAVGKLGSIGSAVGRLGSIGGAVGRLGSIGGAVGRLGSLGGNFARLGGMAGRLGSVGGGLGRLGARVGRLGGPLTSRLGPMVLQQISNRLGPWGLLVRSAAAARRGAMGGGGLSGALKGAGRGIFTSNVGGSLGALIRAARGAQQGYGTRGFEGALHGALGGAASAIPGLSSVLARMGGTAGAAGGVERVFGALGNVGGGAGLEHLLGAFGALAPSGGTRRGLAGLLSGVLGGADGADDDADLDALADISDTGRVAPAVALPLGVALATRTVMNRTIPEALRTPGQRPALAPIVGQTLDSLVTAARAAQGTAGQRLRQLRTVSQLATRMMRDRPGSWRKPGAIVRQATVPVLELAAEHPGLGRVSPAVAQRKLVLRGHLISNVRKSPGGAGGVGLS